MLVLYISNRTINTKQQQGSLFVASEVFLIGYDLIWCRETENLKNKSRFVFSRQQSLDDNLVKKTPRHREYIRIKQGWTLLRHFSLLQKSVFFPWKYIFQCKIFTISINIILKQHFECNNFFLRLPSISEVMSSNLSTWEEKILAVKPSFHSFIGFSDIKIWATFHGPISQYNVMNVRAQKSVE